VTPGVTSFKTDMALNDTRLLDVVPEPWWKVDDPSNAGTSIAERHDGHAVSQPDHPAAVNSCRRATSCPAARANSTSCGRTSALPMTARK
jgi:hypothetical protein